MHTLSIDELHNRRLAIYDNAESLHGEAMLLLQHGKYSRAYLLAHFCFEELGKLPILISVIAQLQREEAVDWKGVKRQLSSHVKKIAAQNGHLYAFGHTDLSGDARLEWLLQANAAVPKSYDKKNLSTYVDVRNGNVVRPSKEINKEDAATLVKLAAECLRSHRRSEDLINPLIYEAVESGTAEMGDYWKDRAPH